MIKPTPPKKKQKVEDDPAYLCADGNHLVQREGSGVASGIGKPVWELVAPRARSGRAGGPRGLCLGSRHVVYPQPWREGWPVGLGAGWQL